MVSSFPAIWALVVEEPMALSKAERTLISRGLKEQKERISFNRDLERQLATSNERRTRVGDRYRQRIIEKALAASGVDCGLIAQRQETEVKSVIRELAGIKKKLKANTAKVKVRHRQLIDRLMKNRANRSGGSPAPEDVSNGYLFVPSSTSLVDQGLPPGATLTTANQSTLLKFRWETTVVKSWGPGITAVVNYLWTPPQDGTFGLFSLVAYNGFCQWAFPGACWTPPYFGLKFRSTIAIQQIDANGLLRTDMADGSNGGLNESHDGGCWPRSGSRTYDAVDYLQLPNPFPVAANLPVLMSITIGGDCLAYSAAAGLDFSTGSACIEQPGILLGFAPW
jgi:hypothetical protein